MIRGSTNQHSNVSIMTLFDFALLWTLTVVPSLERISWNCLNRSPQGLEDVVTGDRWSHNKVICNEKCTLRIVKWQAVNPSGLKDRFIVLLTILPSLLTYKKLLSYLFPIQNISHCGLWPILLCGWDVQCRECIFSGSQQVQHWWHWHHDLSENSSSSTYRFHWQVTVSIFSPWFGIQNVSIRELYIVYHTTNRSIVTDTILVTSRLLKLILNIKINIKYNHKLLF